MFVAETRTHQLLKLDGNGNVAKSWGGKGAEPGKFNAAHMLAFDAAGNLCVAETGKKRVQRFAQRRH